MLNITLKYDHAILKHPFLSIYLSIFFGILYPIGTNVM